MPRAYDRSNALAAADAPDSGSEGLGQGNLNASFSGSFQKDQEENVNKPDVCSVPVPRSSSTFFRSI